MRVLCSTLSGRPGASPLLRSLRAAATRAAEATALIALLASQAAAQPLDTLEGLLWGQTSAEYRAVCQTVYSGALATLRERIRLGAYEKDERGRLCERRWEGAGPRRVLALRPLAVIMDLDETVIDNSGYEAYQQLHHQGYSKETWKRWVSYQHTCPSRHPNRTVPGALTLIRGLEELGVSVFYISNRLEAGEGDGTAGTVRMLTQLGVGSRDLDKRVLLAHSRSEEVTLGKAQLSALGATESSPLGVATLASQSLKERRRTAVALDYAVLAYFGDDLNDFPVTVPLATPPGAAALTLRRQQVEQAAAHWGTDWFVLPNPCYGSWVTSMGKGESSRLLDDQGFGDYLDAAPRQGHTP